MSAILNSLISVKLQYRLNSTNNHSKICRQKKNVRILMKAWQHQLLFNYNDISLRFFWCNKLKTGVQQLNLLFIYFENNLFVWHFGNDKIELLRFNKYHHKYFQLIGNLWRDLNNNGTKSKRSFSGFTITS